jgi:hypothetical protein
MWFLTFGWLMMMWFGEPLLKPLGRPDRLPRAFQGLAEGESLTMRWLQAP